jgi:hypothetical protein
MVSDTASANHFAQAIDLIRENGWWLWFNPHFNHQSRCDTAPYQHSLVGNSATVPTAETTT